jgi:DNA-binding GntR family transcriptional regulator
VEQSPREQSAAGKERQMTEAQPLIPPPVRMVDQVVSLLRSRVLDGTYPPGTRLRQEVLAAELGISRTPLREAFKMLERDGLLVVRPNRGAEVASGDQGSLLDAYRVREVMDGLAARIVAESGASADDLDALQDVIDRQRVALDPWDPDTYGPLNLELHARLLELSGNEYLTSQMAVLHMTANVFGPVRVLDSTRVASAIEEHQRILDAIRAGDADTAEQAARDHIRTTIRTLTNG